MVKDHLDNVEYVKVVEVFLNVHWNKPDKDYHPHRQVWMKTHVA